MDEEIVSSIENLFNFNEINKNFILNQILSDDIVIGNKIDISNDVFKDTLIDKWAINLPILNGGKILMEKIIKKPINNIELLKKRQDISIDFEIDIEILKEYEDDVLWIYKIADEITQNSSIEILFPSSFILCYMNYIEQLLDAFHIYKIYMLPLTSILYPLSTFLAPYYYLNNYTGLNISFESYLDIWWNILKMMFKSSGDIRSDIVKIVSYILYIALYFYNMYQNFEIALFLYKTKQQLHNKMSGLLKFIRHSLYIFNNLSLKDSIIAKYFKIETICTDIKIKNSMTDIYKLWKDDKFKNKLTSLLKAIYAIDVIDAIYKLHLKDDWCKCSYVIDNTLMWDAKNPILNEQQIENPINLKKNIIITGPNAGGKTTYVKTILSNIILAHTFGITNSIKSNIVLYDTINSFMRISDILGSKSYFEVEAEYCLNMMNKATEISENGKRGLFLMDEPMHSTPPTEGMATAYAVSEYLSKLEGITLIITTHFHKLVILEELYPDKFINLSVDAIKKEKGFHFPYKIQRGFSYQCIAIELLNTKEFPQIVIDNAIKMKNKICCTLNK